MEGVVDRTLFCTSRFQSSAECRRASEEGTGTVLLQYLYSTRRARWRLEVFPILPFFNYQ